MCKKLRHFRRGIEKEDGGFISVLPYLYKNKYQDNSTNLIIICEGYHLTGVCN